MLKVSPWKGVIRFGKRGKLNPRYIRPFKIIDKVVTVAYLLELPEQLSRVHNTFHAFNLKKYLANEPLAIPLDEIQIDKKLYFIEEPVDIMDREVKRLKQIRIPIVKNSTCLGLRKKYRLNLKNDMPPQDKFDTSPNRVKGSGYRQDMNPEIQGRIDKCFAYTNALRDRGIDARVVVEAVDREKSETGARGPVEVRVNRFTHPVVADDIPKPVQEGAVEVTYETLGDLVQRFHNHIEAIPVHRIQVSEGVQREQGCRIVGVESAVTTLTERIVELERDNRRLKGTASVKSQRLNRLQRGMSRMQRELRQIRRL
ncbi:hypothetical protein Tco_1160436 [Tanacetum coccineum]